MVIADVQARRPTPHDEYFRLECEGEEH